MANPAMQARHWRQVLALLDQPFDDDDPEATVAGITIQKLLECGVAAKWEDVQAVAAAACKEHSMLKMLEKMEAVRP